jgi:hypothetical protein
MQKMTDSRVARYGAKEGYFIPYASSEYLTIPAGYSEEVFLYNTMVRIKGFAEGVSKKEQYFDNNVIQNRRVDIPTWDYDTWFLLEDICPCSIRFNEIVEGYEVYSLTNNSFSLSFKSRELAKEFHGKLMNICGVEFPVHPQEEVS